MTSAIQQLTDVRELSKQLCPTPIQCELKYATCDNLLGKVINGYHTDAIDIPLLTTDTAKQLCEVQNELIDSNIALKIFDAYRPRRAVSEMYDWAFSKDSSSDMELMRKSIHYPHLNKEDLFNKGYIDRDSTHCIGNTVDLTLVDIETNQELPMGTCFDYMGPKAHIHTIDIHPKAIINRTLLRETMGNHGFRPFELEWWHFIYPKDELIQSVDLDITKDLRGLGCSL